MTNTMLKFTALGLGAALGVGLLAAASCVPDPEPTTPPEVIQEDDPRWDCRTMGNLQCGVTVQGEVYILDFATNTFQKRG